MVVLIVVVGGNSYGDSGSSGCRCLVVTQEVTQWGASDITHVTDVSARAQSNLCTICAFSKLYRRTGIPICTFALAMHTFSTHVFLNYPQGQLALD